MPVDLTDYAKANHPDDTTLPAYIYVSEDSETLRKNYRERKTLLATLEAGIIHYMVVLDTFKDIENQIEAYDTRAPILPDVASIDEYGQYLHAMLEHDLAKKKLIDSYNDALERLITVKHNLIKIMPPGVWLKVGDQRVLYNQLDRVTHIIKIEPLEILPNVSDRIGNDLDYTR